VSLAVAGPRSGGGHAGNTHRGRRGGPSEQNASLRGPGSGLSHSSPSFCDRICGASARHTHAANAEERRLARRFILGTPIGASGRARVANAHGRRRAYAGRRLARPQLVDNRLDRSVRIPRAGCDAAQAGGTAERAGRLIEELRTRGTLGEAVRVDTRAAPPAGDAAHVHLQRAEASIAVTTDGGARCAGRRRVVGHGADEAFIARGADNAACAADAGGAGADRVPTLAKGDARAQEAAPPAGRADRRARAAAGVGGRQMSWGKGEGRARWRRSLWAPPTRRPP